MRLLPRLLLLQNLLLLPRLLLLQNLLQLSLDRRVHPRGCLLERFTVHTRAYLR